MVRKMEDILKDLGDAKDDNARERLRLDAEGYENGRNGSAEDFMDAKDLDRLLGIHEFAAQEAASIADMIAERQDHHGDAEQQHSVLGQLWKGYLLKQTENGLAIRDIGPKDAMLMMLLGKISRIFTGQLARQHVEDIVGYGLLILGQMDREEEARHRQEAEMRRQQDLMSQKMAGTSRSYPKPPSDA